MYRVNKPKPFSSDYNPFSKFRVDYKDPKTNTWKRKTAMDEESANKIYEELCFANKQAEVLKNPIPDESTLQSISYIAKKCKESGIEFSKAADELGQIFGIMDEFKYQKPLSSLSAEVEHWMRLNNPHISFSDALGKFLEYLEKTKCNRTKNVQDRAIRQMKLFAIKMDADKPIPYITTEAVAEYLESLVNPEDGKQIPVATRRSIWVVINSFFNYCKRSGFIAVNPAKSAAPKVPFKEPVIFTVEEIKTIIRRTEEMSVLRLASVIRAFAGIRTCELCRIKWNNFHMDTGELSLPQDVTKTGLLRVVKLPENLKAWLHPFRKRFGKAKPVIPIHSDTYMRKNAELMKEIGIPKKNNAFRHSCASYYLAFTGNESLTATQLGHSVRMLKQNYAQLVSKAQANEYFNIFPENINI